MMKREDPVGSPRDLMSQGEIEEMVLRRLREVPGGRCIWKVRIGPDGTGSWTWKYVGTEASDRGYLPVLDLIVRDLQRQFYCDFRT